MTVRTLTQRPLPSSTSPVRIQWGSPQESHILLSWLQALPNRQVVHVTLAPIVPGAHQVRTLRRQLLSLGCTVSTQHHV